MVIQQVMTMVMEMMQSGASEERIVVRLERDGTRRRRHSASDDQWLLYKCKAKTLSTDKSPMMMVMTLNDSILKKSNF